MKEYHKIQSVYKRDPDNKFKTFLLGDYSLDEFEYLKDNIWDYTEKIDGTNVRVQYNLNPFGYWQIDFKGKTDKTELPKPLLAILREKITVEKLKKAFDEDTVSVCLYGEGFGPKIQKGGGNYGKEQAFVLFDVKVGDIFLKREDVVDIAGALGLQVVPIIGRGPLYEMVQMARKGFNSQWGDFRAEGIVARPRVELIARNGNRIITKVKCKDFK